MTVEAHALMVFGRRSKVADPKSPGTPGAGVQGEDRALSEAPGEEREFSTEALSYIDALYGTALRLTRRPLAR